MKNVIVMLLAVCLVSSCGQKQEHNAKAPVRVKTLVVSPGMVDNRQLNQHHQLTEYLAQVTTVYLVNDEHVCLFRILLGPFTEVVEDTIANLEFA